MGMASKLSRFPRDSIWSGAGPDVGHAGLSFVEPSIWTSWDLFGTRDYSSRALLLDHSAPANVADDSCSIRTGRGGVDKRIDSSRLTGYHQTLADWMAKCSGWCTGGGSIDQCYRTLLQSFSMV